MRNYEDILNSWGIAVHVQVYAHVHEEFLKYNIYILLCFPSKYVHMILQMQQPITAYELPCNLHK